MHTASLFARLNLVNRLYNAGRITRARYEAICTRILWDASRLGSVPVRLVCRNTCAFDV